jgi:hypothetical protein
VQICDLVHGLICDVMHKLNHQVIGVVTLFNKLAVVPCRPHTDWSLLLGGDCGLGTGAGWSEEPYGGIVMLKRCLV